MTNYIEEELAACIKKQLQLLGFDPNDPNFEDTPQRVARMWKSFLQPKQFKMTSFPLEQKGGMIVVKNHECWSFCPHHLLPVKYICTIGYIPERRVLGLSKLAWIADDCMRDLPLQESLPEMIGRRIIEAINPKGVGVIIKGEHLCMRMRGVESTTAEAVSSFMSGIFLTDSKAREEFLTL